MSQPALVLASQVVDLIQTCLQRSLFRTMSVCDGGADIDWNAYTHVVMGKIPEAKSPTMNLQKVMAVADWDSAQPIWKSCFQCEWTADSVRERRYGSQRFRSGILAERACGHAAGGW